MAESPDEGHSMNGGRSLKLFDWFFLPLLSLCNSGRNDANCVQVVNSGSPIDKQPEGRPPIEGMPNNDNMKRTPIDDYSVRGPPTDRETEGIVSSDCYSVSYSQSFSTSSTILTDLSIGSDFEPVIGSQSITEIDNSSNDQLKLSDLPLLALLTICTHLKPEFPIKRYTDLYNFRQTCRTFAYAVNSFFEKPANLPIIQEMSITFIGGWLDIRASMETINYLLHPLRTNRAVFHGGKPDWIGDISVSTRFHIDNDVIMEIAAKAICGPVYSLELMIGRRNGVDKVFKLCSNFTSFKKLGYAAYNLNNEIGSHILSLVRHNLNPEVGIVYNRSDMNDDAPEFVTQLYSSTNRLVLIPEKPRRTFLGKSTDFWANWLLQKMEDGWKIKCNGEEFDEETEISQSVEGGRIRELDLRK